MVKLYLLMEGERNSSFSGDGGINKSQELSHQSDRTFMSSRGGLGWGGGLGGGTD